MAWTQGRAFLLVAIASWAIEVAAEEAPRLRIERLAWAGIKLELGEATLLIDAVDNPDVLGALTRVPVAVTTPRRYAVATHLHNDHYDRALLKGVLGDRGRMLCPASLAAEVVSDGLRVRSVGMGEAVTVGPFTLIPVPAVDGVGDEQVSWIVFAAGTRLLHAGDTLWHGSWERTGAQYGPFDVAFLPINAAILGGERPPHAQPISALECDRLEVEGPLRLAGPVRHPRLRRLAETRIVVLAARNEDAPRRPRDRLQEQRQVAVQRGVAGDVAPEQPGGRRRGMQDELSSQRLAARLHFPGHTSDASQVQPSR